MKEPLPEPGESNQLVMGVPSGEEGSLYCLFLQDRLLEPQWPAIFAQCFTDKAVHIHTELGTTFLAGWTLDAPCIFSHFY